jgi:DNA-binding transcriptional MerR regulator
MGGGSCGAGKEEEKRGVIPRKLFKIGEVMRYSKLSRQTIHNYTMLGLITEEERTESGHRLYGEEVFAQLERIRKLGATRTLKEIREILDQERVSREDL